MQEIAPVFSGEGTTMGFRDRFNFDAYLAQVQDVAAPPWTGCVDWRATLRPRCHEAFQRPSVAPAYNDAKGFCAVIFN